MEINQKTISNFFNEVWKWIKKYSQKVWSFLTSSMFGKIVGILLVVFSSVTIFLETIIIGLIHSDNEKFQEIIKYFFDINIFDYISKLNFHLITGGGYLIDMAFYVILLLLGIYLWKKKNYFKNKKIIIAIFSALIIGVITFSTAFYKAMPQIMIPLEKICQKSNFDVDYKKDFKLEREKFHKGYYEKVFFDNRGEQRFFQYIDSRF